MSPLLGGGVGWGGEGKGHKTEVELQTTTLVIFWINLYNGAAEKWASHLMPFSVIFYSFLIFLTGVHQFQLSKDKDILLVNKLFEQTQFYTQWIGRVVRSILFIFPVHINFICTKLDLMRRWRTFGDPYFSFQKQFFFTIIYALSKNEQKINVGRWKKFTISVARHRILPSCGCKAREPTVAKWELVVWGTSTVS